MKLKYWLRINKETLGPLGIDEIQKVSGISENSLVCPAGATAASDWRKLREVTEFAQALRRASAPPSPLPRSAPPPLPNHPPSAVPPSASANGSGYIGRNLLPDEGVVAQTKLHWVVLAPPAILWIMAIWMRLFLVPDSPELLEIWKVISNWGFILPTTVMSINAVWNFFFSEFSVTNKRIMIKVGCFSRRSLELLLPKVEGIGVDQGILGHILDYRTLVVNGTGGTKEMFAAVEGPLMFRQRIQEQIYSSLRAR